MRSVEYSDDNYHEKNVQENVFEFNRKVVYKVIRELK